jgi:hypothetical protein
MLSLLHDLPLTVVGVKATGLVQKKDYDLVLKPAMEDLFKRHGRVSLLLQIETDLDNYTMAAWLEDAKLGLRYFAKWNKVAIVSRNKNVKWFTDTFGLLVPGTYKGFMLTDLVEAKRWISA